MTERQTRRYYKNQMGRDEKRWAREIKKMFSKQLKDLIALIREAKLPEVIISELPQVINDEGTLELYERLYTVLGEKYYTITQASLSDKSALGRIHAGKKLEPDDPYFIHILELVRSSVGYRVSTIQETSRELVSKEIQDLIAVIEEQGLGIDEAAKLIEAKVRDRWLTTVDYRAARIARTETGTLANMASDLGAKNTGLNYVKKWLAFMDNNTRADHADANGDEVEKGEAFIVGSSELQYPCDPKGPPEQVINCRCVLQYVVPEFTVN